MRKNTLPCLHLNTVVKFCMLLDMVTSVNNTVVQFCMLLEMVTSVNNTEFRNLLSLTFTGILQQVSSEDTNISSVQQKDIHC